MPQTRQSGGGGGDLHSQKAMAPSRDFRLVKSPNVGKFLAGDSLPSAAAEFQIFTLLLFLLSFPPSVTTELALSFPARCRENRGTTKFNAHTSTHIHIHIHMHTYHIYFLTQQEVM